MAQSPIDNRFSGFGVRRHKKPPFGKNLFFREVLQK
jgi:hypothetical protein